MHAVSHSIRYTERLFPGAHGYVARFAKSTVSKPLGCCQVHAMQNLILLMRWQDGDIFLDFNYIFEILLVVGGCDDEV